MKKYALLFSIYFIIINFLQAQPGADLFDQNQIHEIHIQLQSTSDWNFVEQNYQTYLDGGPNNYTPVQITIDGEALGLVGLRIRTVEELNADSSRRYPFKIDFNEFASGQNYHGLKKLNTETEEMYHHFVAADIFREADLPVSRTSFAEVFIDGESIGISLLLEQIDKPFLSWNFSNNNGNLYKTKKKYADLNWLGMAQSPYENFYSLETNEGANDYSSLIDFIQFIDASDPVTFENNINDYLDISSFLLIQAVEVLLGLEDTYYDFGHNFFMYHHPDEDRFYWIPWDHDRSFDKGYGSFLDMELSFNNLHQRTVLFSKIFNNSNLKNKYLNSICYLIEEDIFNTTRLNNLLLQVDNLLISNGQMIDESPDEIIQFVADRILQAENELQTIGHLCQPLNTIESKKNNIRIFPNPANDFIFWEGAPASGVLIDFTGKTVLNFYNKNKINTKNLPSGLYFLSMRDQKKYIITKKIIKE